MNIIKKNLKRFQYAIAGVIFAVRTDYSFRVQIYLGGTIVAILIYIFSPLTYTELMFLILAYFLILITELQNSAFEAALDHLHPELHHNIGKSKDMAAGSVFLAGLFLLTVISILLYVRVF